MMEAEEDKKGTTATGNKDNKDNKNNASNSEEESFVDKMKRGANSCCAKTGLCCFKFKEQSQISGLDFKITQLQKKFGVDYLTLVEQKAAPDKLKNCLKEALSGIAELQNQINEHHDAIDDKEEQVNEQVSAGPGSSTKPKPKPKPKKTKEESKTEEGAGGESSGEPKKKAPVKKKKKPDEFSIDD
jgi:hypothetical protein